MISVAFVNEAGSITMELTGHAEAARKGEDIICAAASILTYTVAQTIQYMYEDGVLEDKPTIKLDNGDACIIAKPKPETYTEALHTFFVAQVGYHLLAQSYPQCVELNPFGEA